MHADCNDEGERQLRLALLVLFALATSACSQSSASNEIAKAPAIQTPLAIPAMTEIPNPAAAKSYYPMLNAGAGDELLMSWQEPLSGVRCRLRFATRHAGSWQRVSTVAEGYFAPYSTMIPGVLRLDGGALFAYWTDWDRKWVYTSTSRDGGERWTSPRVVHKDRSDEDHGFISAVADGHTASIVCLMAGTTRHTNDLFCWRRVSRRAKVPHPRSPSTMMSAPAVQRPACAPRKDCWWPTATTLAAFAISPWYGTPTALGPSRIPYIAMAG